VSFIHSDALESWRSLFLIEGGFTLLLAVIALIVLPEQIVSCRWLIAEEKEFCEYFQLPSFDLLIFSDVRAIA